MSSKIDVLIEYERTQAVARFTYSSTPNPDSIKILRKKGVFIDSGLLSFSSSEQASSHPLASDLFSIVGITNILILPEFLTVSKEPELPWRPLWKEVEKALEAFYPR